MLSQVIRTTYLLSALVGSEHVYSKSAGEPRPDSHAVLVDWNKDTGWRELRLRSLE